LLDQAGDTGKPGTHASGQDTPGHRLGKRKSMIQHATQGEPERRAPAGIPTGNACLFPALRFAQVVAWCSHDDSAPVWFCWRGKNQSLRQTNGVLSTVTGPKRQGEDRVPR